MPEKKSFILYIDRKKEIDLLTAEQCGVVFKAIFDYVDSGNIIDIDDIAVKLMFSVFKSQIDECSVKWEEVRQKRSEAGKKGMASRWNNKDNKNNKVKQTKTNDNKDKQTITKITDTVTVTDTVVSVTNVTDTLSQPCTAAGAAAQADNENGIRYGRVIGGYQTIIDDNGNEVIPIDPNDDFWA